MTDFPVEPIYSNDYRVQMGAVTIGGTPAGYRVRVTRLSDGEHVTLTPVEAMNACDELAGLADRLYRAAFEADKEWRRDFCQHPPCRTGFPPPGCDPESCPHTRVAGLPTAASLLFDAFASRPPATSSSSEREEGSHARR